MRLQTKEYTNLYNTSTGQSVASSAGNCEAVRGYTIVSQVTVSTPAAKTFTDGSVNTGTEKVTITAHGYFTGLVVRLTSTGVLPAGLALATDYYVIVIDANTIQFASSLVNANAGTAVDITAAAGGGTHTSTSTALAGASIKLQATIDGSAWIDLASSSQSITTTTNFMWNVDAPYYLQVRSYITLTTGMLTVRTDFVSKANL